MTFKNHDELVCMQSELLRLVRRGDEPIENAEDRLQDLNLRLLSKRDDINSLPHYSAKAAKNARCRPETAKRGPSLVNMNNLDQFPTAKSSGLSAADGEDERMLSLRKSISQLPRRHRLTVEKRLNGDGPGDRRERKLYCEAVRTLQQLQGVEPPSRPAA